MFIVVTGSDCRGLESVEDQVFAEIRDVVQAPESDLTARGVAIDLLQMAKQVGPQCDAAEHEDLSGEEGFPLDSIVVDDRRNHRKTFGDGTVELSMKAPMSVSKPADLG